MPISFTTVTSGSKGTTAEFADTASVSPTANRLQLLSVHGHPAGGPGYATVTGCGLTWVEIDRQNYDVGGGDTQQLFRALGASPSTGVLTIDYGTTPTDDQLEICWSLVEADTIDISGSDGSGAIVQSAKSTGSSTTPATTLAAFGSTDNATYGAFVCGSAGFPLGIGSGYTSLHNFQGPTVGLVNQTEWRVDNDTTVDATSGAATAWGAMAVEIKAGGPAPRIVFPAAAVSMG